MRFKKGVVVMTIAVALGGAGLARCVNLVRGTNVSWLAWNDEALDAMLEAALLRYLAVAHFGRGHSLWHAGRGDWERAHAIVQADESVFGCWAHGIAHMMEGDMGNARYWYRRAGQSYEAFPDPKAELAAIKAVLSY